MNEMTKCQMSSSCGAPLSCSQAGRCMGIRTQRDEINSLQAKIRDLEARNAELEKIIAASIADNGGVLKEAIDRTEAAEGLLSIARKRAECAEIERDKAEARVKVLEEALRKIEGMGGVCLSENDNDADPENCPQCCAWQALAPLGSERGGE